METTEYRGYRFSRLCLGTVQLGMPYGISNRTGVPPLQESTSMLQHAAAAGINTFDTARQYGHAEAVLADYMAATASKPHIVSKFKISAANITNLEAAWHEAESSVKESLRVLNIPRLPVCLLHKSTEPARELMKIVPEILRRLKAEGLINIGGISAFYPEDVEYVLGEEIIEATQIPVNVLDQRLIRNRNLTRLQQQNKLVFARSVFLQGLFFMDEAALKGNLTAAAPHLRQLRQLAAEAGMSVAQLAFSFVRDLPGISSLVIGAVNTEQIEENVALMNGPAIPAAVYAKLANVFSKVEEVVLTPGMWNK